MKNILIAVVAAAVGALAVFALGGSAEKPAGAAGSTFSFPVAFQDNVVVGGYDFATSSAGTVTYTAVSFARARVIEHIATGAVTASLPTNAALSAAGYLPAVGDTQTVMIHASTTIITLAGNTGVVLGSATSTRQINPGQTGLLSCARLGAAESRSIQCILVTD
jgi:hypothetical protein